ncbi:hypothetical protein [truncated ORF], partial [Aspergillus niger]|uniref:Uncharacterized protein n=2 Tax=Aspergillus niger TaxID=5061 RepID=A0AAJ8BTZ9_ASPNG
MMKDSDVQIEATDPRSYRFCSRGRFARFGLHMMNITNSGWPDALHSSYNGRTVIEQARPGGTEGERERERKSRESVSVSVWCVVDPKVFRASIHL